MPKENTTRYIILGLLDHEPMSGYDIKKRVDIIVSQFWNVGFAQIYPTLAVLEGEGLVLRKASGEKKGPQRHAFEITETGRQALRGWLKTPAQKEYTKYEILLKLYFSGGMPPENSVRSIREFRERQQRQLGMVQAFRKNLEAVLDEDEDHLYYYLTVLFGERVYGAYLEWADEALALMATHMKKED